MSYVQVICDGPGRDRTCDLGIKSGRHALVVARGCWKNRVVAPDQLGPVRVRWRGIVDLPLTHFVICVDNDFAHVDAEDMFELPTGFPEAGRVR
jgi:hypothetical protein